jgi:hypothetical protein
MAARLLGQPAAGVDEDDGEVGGRRARDHVARVLRVAGAVVQHEPPLRRREVAVGDVDRDALLALGAQPVGQVREVLEVRLLVGHQRLGVVEQAPDQRRLAVVHRPRRRDPEHQKYPTLLRSSMAASDTRSSARVSPRSVTRVAAISATTSSSEAAVERTAPVQLMSPTVR